MSSNRPIFISYRRSDSEYIAGSIYDRLVHHFGEGLVFFDIDAIPLGQDFREYIDQSVGQCQLMLVIIGNTWISVQDKDGKPRLQSEIDFVRLEIESALRRKIPIIPVLVKGAVVPSSDELPASLSNLPYINGIKVRPGRDFHKDIDDLIQGIVPLVDFIDLPQDETVETSRSTKRFNSYPEDIFEEGDLFIGVEKVIIYDIDTNDKQQIVFPVKGIDKPAVLKFDQIAPNYPFALAVSFPAYRRTAYFDVEERFVEAFEDGSLKEDWKLHATVYDINNDGIPEVLVALNRWDSDDWDVNSSVNLLVYTFHPPINIVDLDRSENWGFAGKQSGQLLVLFDEEKIILPIGSRDGYLYLLKNDHLIEAGACWKDNNGRYKPY